MIIRVERFSKNIQKPSTFSVVSIIWAEIISFNVSFFSGYHRAGMKGSLMLSVFKTAKYTKENCNKVLKFVEREIN